MQNKEIYINDLVKLEHFASEFAAEICERERVVIYLHGDLGGGKTALTQFVIGFLGCKERVKSPTYSLVEPYEIKNHKIYHLDLYRLQDTQELYFMGIADLFERNAFFFIEWPERLASLSIRPDIEISLKIDENNVNARFLKVNYK